MLNTIPLKKNNDIIQHITEESILDEGIRRIGEKTNNIFDEHIVSHHVHNGGNIFSLPEKNISADDKIVQEKLQQFKLNVVSNDKTLLVNEDKKIMVSINELSSKISVVDENNKPIGYFTVSHIVKYLGNVYDTKQQFLPELNNEVYKQGKTIIKKLIFKLNYNKKNKYADIVLLDHKQSGFMCDTELLVKLNSLLDNYHKTQLQNDIASVYPHNKVKIEQNINKFIFLLINYTLSTISLISEQIKDDNTKTELKQRLLKYSIGLNYKLNMFVQQQLQFIHNQNNKIKEALDENLTIKNIIMEKLEGNIKNIKESKQINNKSEISLLKTKSASKPLSTSAYYEY